MNENQLPDPVRIKFPHLKPLKRTPVLYSVNGIGVSIYGKRDWDEETRTYVKTRCVCFIMVPIFAVDAYRVADAGANSWFFFGKERLSHFARMWNMAMTLAMLVGGLAIGWNVHTSSPAYRAQQEIKRAAALMQSGLSVQAAEIYQQQVNGPEAAAARQGLHDSIETCLKSDKARTVATALRIVSMTPVTVRPAVLTDAFQTGISSVEKFRTNDADGALEILNETAKFSPTNSVLKPLQIELLKEIIVAQPDNTNRVVELALIYENNQQRDECIALLRPHQKKLGATEGARILGQQLLSEGKNEDAYELLFPYVQTRLARLRSIESSYTNAMAYAYKSALKALNDGDAAGFSYDSYKSASKEEQNNMVDRFIQSWMRSDAGMQRAQAALKEANKIVPVTLDLGIVQLNRAQNLQDPAARKAELEAAEKTFLAIQGFAGETDEYRMFLGQVYYWLGKSKEGKELFDQLLASKKRAYPILMSLTGTLREVGEYEQARQLCEEAYAAGKKDHEKYDAASLRARIDKNNDDEIAWLEKADPNEPDIQISLNDSRGQKALHNGNRELAAQFFRKAVAGYENLRKTSATLNNHGLACMNLYRVTGDIHDHDQGLALIEEAVSLSPGNSVLLINTADLLLDRAYMDVVGDAIRFNIIKDAPDRGMLRYLYTDESGRREIYQRLQDNEHFKKGIAYLDKSLLLSPKRAQLYLLSLSVQNPFRNLPELQRLEQRLVTSSPDLSDILNGVRENYSGAKTNEQSRLLQSERKRYESLLAVADITNHAPSLEFVRVELNRLQLSLATLGEPVDGEKIIGDARTLFAQHDDAATLDNLIGAQFFVAHQDLSRQNSDYAKLAALTKHSLTPRSLIAFLIEHHDALSQIVRQNPNVLKAIELAKEHGKRFPTYRPVNDWALLAALNSSEAADVSRQLLADEAARLADQIEFQLDPLSGSNVLEQYWTHKMRGDEKGGVEIYQTALKNGVPLPPL